MPRTAVATQTPGPWKIVQESVDPEWHIITADGGRIMANVHIEQGNLCDQANARLLTESPAMYGLLADVIVAVGPLLDTDPNGEKYEALWSLHAEISQLQDRVNG